ncbi:MAG TPA: chemotaxis protein CheB [Phenylobacterium sp.]|uniref:chemotaxis protein CheB n=1 Tax=Phenylobacterium sp. TaxID=1871053 RepID=UPI002B488CB9|nr:chemotaxis protein CheB [Phenylobacterium sp.]HKR87977.1 chemotaxis protein CheB [Phenylobacterium sp.]
MDQRRDIVVLAASLGGLAAIRDLAAALPARFDAALLVVLHTHPQSPGLLDEIIGACTPLPVSYASQGEPVERGHVYLAPADRHLTVKPPGKCMLDTGPKVHFHRPAADPLFESAARTFGPRVIAVVLTGRDSDGAEGLRAIKGAGGIGVVQDPAEAMICLTDTSASPVGGSLSASDS